MTEVANEAAQVSGINQGRVPGRVQLRDEPAAGDAGSGFVIGKFVEEVLPTT